MAVKKIEIRPKGTGDYADVLYPRTSVDMVDGALANTDYVRTLGYGATAGSANAYTLTLSPVLAAYADGVAVSVKIHAANTGASTLDVNGLGAKSLLKASGSALAANDLLVGSIYTFRYNGTNFILQGEGGGDGNIKSIQRGFVDTINLTSINIPISAVDITTSIAFIQVEGLNSNANSMFNVELTSSTNLLLNRQSATNVSQIIRWWVVTFNNVKSKQTGVATATTTGSVNVTVSSVAQGKSICFVSCTSNDATTVSYSYVMYSYDLTSDTVLTISRRSLSYVGTFTHKWQLIEFK